jgi:hypothetical protein
MPGPAAERLLAEIATLLGSLSQRVMTVDQSVQSLATRLGRAPSRASASEIPVGAVVFPCDRLGATGNLLPLEVSPEGISFRWSGAEPALDMEFAVQRKRNKEMELRLHALVRPEFARQLKLIVDGTHRPHDFRKDGPLYLVRCNLPARNEAGPTRVRLELPSTHSPSELGASVDSRRLGVAICEVRFQPPASMLTRLRRVLRLGA